MAVLEVSKAGCVLLFLGFLVVSVLPQKEDREVFTMSEPVFLNIVHLLPTERRLATEAFPFSDNLVELVAVLFAPDLLILGRAQLHGRQLHVLIPDQRAGEGASADHPAQVLRAESRRGSHCRLC